MTEKIEIATYVLLAAIPFWFYWCYIFSKTFLAKHYWKKIKATITEISIQEKSDLEWGLSYHPSIKYEYLIKGVKYIGDKFIYNDESGFNEDYLNNLGVTNWLCGNEIEISYNPFKPESSVIIVKLARGVIFKVIFTGLLSIYGVLLWFSNVS